jgi:hypothetical protein
MMAWKSGASSTTSNEYIAVLDYRIIPGGKVEFHAKCQLIEKSAHANFSRVSFVKIISDRWSISEGPLTDIRRGVRQRRAASRIEVLLPENNFLLYPKGFFATDHAAFRPSKMKEPL